MFHRKDRGYVTYYRVITMKKNLRVILSYGEGLAFPILWLISVSPWALHSSDTVIRGVFWGLIVVLLAAEGDVFRRILGGGAPALTLPAALLTLWCGQLSRAFSGREALAAGGGFLLVRVVELALVYRRNPEERNQQAKLLGKGILLDVLFLVCYGWGSLKGEEIKLGIVPVVLICLGLLLMIWEARQESRPSKQEREPENLWEALLCFEAPDLFRNHGPSWSIELILVLDLLLAFRVIPLQAMSVSTSFGASAAAGILLMLVMGALILFWSGRPGAKS